MTGAGCFAIPECDERPPPRRAPRGGFNYRFPEPEIAPPYHLGGPDSGGARKNPSCSVFHRLGVNPTGSCVFLQSIFFSRLQARMPCKYPGHFPRPSRTGPNPRGIPGIRYSVSYGSSETRKNRSKTPGFIRTADKIPVV